MRQGVTLGLSRSLIIDSIRNEDSLTNLVSDKVGKKSCMQSITQTFILRDTPSGLAPASPRTLRDLSRSGLTQGAALHAQSLKEKGLEVDQFVKSLDETTQDSNHDFPGHVKVSGVEYDGHEFEGSTIAYPSSPRELKGTIGTLKNTRRFRSDLVTEYNSSSSGAVERTTNLGTRKEVTEKIFEADGLVHYVITGKPGRHELLVEDKDAGKGPQTCRTSYSGSSRHTEFELDRPRHFNEEIPWGSSDQFRWEPISHITDPQRAADLIAAKAANEAIQKNLEVYEQVMALDQSPEDLNDRPGEVLLQDANVGKRVLSGSVMPLVERFSTPMERHLDNSRSNEPYMDMHSSNTNESFQASLGDGADRARIDWPGDTRLTEFFLYSNDEQRVRAAVGQPRKSSPRFDIDANTPRITDQLGGSVVIDQIAGDASV